MKELNGDKFIEFIIQAHNKGIDETNISLIEYYNFLVDSLIDICEEN